MNIIKQMAIILGCLAFGEFVVYVTGMKLPASIIGLLTLFGLLQFKVLKVHHVSKVGDFLLQNMGIFFVPPCVAMLNYFDILSANFLPIVVSTIVSTLLVVVITGFTHQIIRKSK